MLGDVLLIIAAIASILLVILLIKMFLDKIGKRIVFFKLSVVLTIIISLLLVTTAYGYYQIEQSRTEILQDIENLENELESTWNQLNNSNLQLNNVQAELDYYEILFQENSSILQSLRAGDEYHLHDPTYKEALDCVKKYSGTYLDDLFVPINNKGIRCAYVWLLLNGSNGDSYGLNLVGFNTMDEGMVYFEIDTYYRVYPEIGKQYWECVEGTPYGSVSPYDDTITEILLIW